MRGYLCTKLMKGCFMLLNMNLYIGMSTQFSFRSPYSDTFSQRRQVSEVWNYVTWGLKYRFNSNWSKDSCFTYQMLRHPRRAV